MEIFNPSASSQFAQSSQYSKIKLKSFSKFQNKGETSSSSQAYAPSIKKLVLIIFKSSDDDQVFQKYCQRLQTQKEYITCAKFTINNIIQYRQKRELNKNNLDYWVLTSSKNYLTYGKQMENIKNFIIYGDLNLTKNDDSKQRATSNINEILGKANVADFTSNINLLDNILQKRKLAIKTQNLNEKQNNELQRKKQCKTKVGCRLPVQQANTYIQHSSLNNISEQNNIEQNPNQQPLSYFPQFSKSSALYNTANLVGKGSNKQINLIQYDKYIENGLTVYRKRKSIIQPSIITNKMTQNYNPNQNLISQSEYGKNYLNYVNTQNCDHFPQSPNRKNSSIQENQFLNTIQNKPNARNFNQPIYQNNMGNKLRVSDYKTQRNSQQLKKLLDQKSLMREQQYFPKTQNSSLSKNIRPKRKSSQKKSISSTSRSKLQRLNDQIKNPQYFQQKNNKNSNSQHFSSTSPNKADFQYQQTGQPYKKINKTTSFYPKNYNQNQVPPNQQFKKSSCSNHTYQREKKVKTQNIGIQCDFQQIKSVFQQLSNKLSFIKQNSKLPQSTLESLSQFSNFNNTLQKHKSLNKQNKPQHSNNYPSFGQKQKSTLQQSNSYNQKSLQSKIETPQRNQKLKSRSYMSPFSSLRLNINKNIPKTASQYYFKQQILQKPKQIQKQQFKENNPFESLKSSESLKKSRNNMISTYSSPYKTQPTQVNKIFSPFKQEQNKQKQQPLNQLNVSINQISILYLIDRLKKDTLLKQLQKIVCEKDSIYTFKNPQQLYNQIKQSKGIYEFTFIFSEQLIPSCQNQSIFEKYPWCYFVNLDPSLKKGEFALKHNIIDVRQVSQLSDIIDAIIQARKIKDDF